MSNHTGITLGVNPSAVKEARGAINDILRAKVDQQTMIAALQALTKITRIKGAVISGNSIRVGD